MDLSSARSALVQESRELLAAMERALLEIEADGLSFERINAAFRAAHTIKGSAGLFSFDLIVSFTHVMESVLERVRSETLRLGGEQVSVLLRCGDYLAQLVDSIEVGGEYQDPDPQLREALLGALRGFIEGGSAVKDLVVDESATWVSREPDRGAGNEHWHLSLRFGPDVLRNGMDPLSFIHYLSGLGQISGLYPLRERLPRMSDFNPETCYLGFEIDLISNADKKTLSDVFEFVREDSQIRILPPSAKIDEFIELIAAQPESSQRLGEILIAGGTLTADELAEVLALQAQLRARGGESQRLGELLVQERMVQPPVVAAALSQQMRCEEKRAVAQSIVKVEAGKLDQLINLVGELVIASAGARLKAERTRQTALVEVQAEVSQLVEQIRDRALNLRMIQIGEVFQRFPRVVRDVALELGKKIELVITGAETELDKSMVERLADPLMHIVRNAMDHGIEPVDAREAAGKPAVGKVHLHAFHESGCVVIEVRDDGRGLDTERIRAKAIERGLIPAEATLSAEEIHRLIFAPGFSTAEQVTSLSGRGVGMDVVKREIDKLRGEIELDSVHGQGTCLRIRLPLTLAIIDGFLVSVAKSTFVVPLDMVEECIEFTPEAGRDCVKLRDRLLPTVRLKEFFGVKGESAARQNVVVVKYAGHQLGLVVDELIGEAQIVIKPLPRMFSQIKGISGASLLGSGDVSLIIDLPELLRQALRAPRGNPASQKSKNESGLACCLP